MLVFLLVFAALGLGIVVGLRAAAWAHTTYPAPSHTFCEHRFQNMEKKLRAQILAKEAEIQDLIHRGIA